MQEQREAIIKKVTDEIASKGRVSYYMTPFFEDGDEDYLGDLVIPIERMAFDAVKSIVESVCFIYKIKPEYIEIAAKRYSRQGTARFPSLVIPGDVLMDSLEAK